MLRQENDPHSLRRRMDQYHPHEVPKPQILRENKEFWTAEGNVKIRKTGPILYQCQWWRSWRIHNERIEWYKHRLLWSPDSPLIIKGLFDREAQFNDGRTSCTWQGCKYWGTWITGTYVVLCSDIEHRQGRGSRGKAPGVLLQILGRGVPPGSPNPGPI